MEKKYFKNQLDENIRLIENIFSKDCILRKRPFEFCSVRACLFYFDGMVNVELINESILKPLGLADGVGKELPIADFVADKLLFASEIKKTDLVYDALSSIMYGDTLLLLENSSTAITINSKGWRTRGISEPENERVTEGPREGFDEAAMFNTAMLRRKLQTPDFCVELCRMGRRTNTFVFICYLKSLVNRDVLRRLKESLGKIDIDAVLDSHYLTEQIRDNKLSLFKTVGHTERPDVAAARLLEGRIALIVDGTPVVLTLPYLFEENFQSDEDYYINFFLASAGRIMRLLAFFISITIPAGYIAITTHHFEFLPTAFAETVSSSRTGVPFPTILEGLILIFVFEVLRETGVRMPQGVGHALSIVGGLVVGQSAVEARLVSAPMLIAVALSGICGLMVPRLKTAVFYLRFIFVFGAGVFGIFGILLLGTFVILQILSLTSFGVDSTLSLKNPSFQGIKDVFIRASWTKMLLRPPIQYRNMKRKKI